MLLLRLLLLCCCQNNIAAKFKDMDVLQRGKAIDLFETAARATARHVCDEALQKLETNFVDVYNYVMEHPPSSWASSHKTRPDFMKVTSNVVGECCLAHPLHCVCLCNALLAL
jgi:hypothetical protein